ncbi:MAG: endo-1,4-beta-xylanase [Planctomycetota bacterium]|jgi:GH35 family endo-1,4-beta-xylanase
MRSTIILLVATCVCSGQTTYEGRSQDAPWREAARARIEEIRKAPLKVEVVDFRGELVRGAKVRVKMRRHKFGFGNILNPRTFQLEGEDGLKYRQIFAEHFNKTTFESGFRWQNWYIPAREGKLGEHKNLLDGMIRFCQSRDIGIRGHYLSWAPLSRDYYKPTDYQKHPDRLWPELSAHIDEMLAFINGRLVEWDAINHIIGWNGTMADVTGSNEIYAKIIRHARSKTTTPLWINEGAILPGGDRAEAYEKIVRYLFENDAGPDGIGFMAHFKHQSLRPIDELWQTYERFAKFGVPLQLTEFDIDTTDEQLQAEYLRDVMTITFSHPAFNSIVMWGFWEGRHWRPNGALWRKDWSIKPCGKMWKELVFETWWTSEQRTTNTSGRCEVSAFLGEYDIVVEHAGRETAVQTTVDKTSHRATVITLASPESAVSED